jgi:Conjugal transfer protein
LLMSVSLGACATAWKPPEISYDNTPKPAVLQPDPPKPVQIVELPNPLPLPGQLKPIPAGRTAPPEAADPHVRVEQANGAARIQPTGSGYLNAIQVYPFSDGALYQVYAAPGEITDIALEPGEQLVGSGPVAADDTVRWIIGDTESRSRQADPHSGKAAAPRTRHRSRHQSRHQHIIYLYETKPAHHDAPSARQPAAGDRGAAARLAVGADGAA